ncbi:hypothetical protein [Actinokineospora pegani]|uniref:hypothetical protein n=1 Tax=Actinokineospora pegani TaxID=2654637 RepID=UPI0012E99602|nr:hypothetical protein [Actinokineospora pegani]
MAEPGEGDDGWFDEPPEVPVLDASVLPDLVADLARAGELHHRRLDILRAALLATDARLGEVDAVVADLAEPLSEVADPTRPSRWAWPLQDRATAEQLWREVRWFVDHRTGRYPLSTELSLPPCWYRHTIAVDELTDLYAAWREAYFAGDRPTSTMLTWRDRCLWPSLTRLATAADWRECKAAKTHVPPTARQLPIDNDFEQHLEADLATRPEAPPQDWPWSPAETP